MGVYFLQSIEYLANLIYLGEFFWLYTKSFDFSISKGLDNLAYQV